MTVARTPLAREGTPADVAGAVVFLASPLAGFITGETIEVNGGQGLF
jgi:3-oxoacyl-[acyl-carrier protein] reductase